MCCAGNLARCNLKANNARPSTSRRILRAATAALKEGRLHPDQWAVIEELLLDGLAVEAAYLAQHGAAAPIYAVIHGV
jgi:hypothetical protein